MNRKRVLAKYRPRGKKYFYSKRPIGGIRQPDLKLSTPVGMLNFMRGVFRKHNVVYDPKRDMLPSKLYLRPEVYAEMEKGIVSFLLPPDVPNRKLIERALVAYDPGLVCSAVSKEELKVLTLGIFDKCRRMETAIAKIKDSMRPEAYESMFPMTEEEIMKLTTIDGFNNMLGVYRGIIELAGFS